MKKDDGLRKEIKIETHPQAPGFAFVSYGTTPFGVLKLEADLGLPCKRCAWIWVSEAAFWAVGLIGTDDFEAIKKMLEHRVSEPGFKEKILLTSPWSLTVRG